MKRYVCPGAHTSSAQHNTPGRCTPRMIITPSCASKQSLIMLTYSSTSCAKHRAVTTTIGPSFHGAGLSSPQQRWPDNPRHTCLFSLQLYFHPNMTVFGRILPNPPNRISRWRPSRTDGAMQTSGKNCMAACMSVDCQPTPDSEGGGVLGHTISEEWIGQNKTGRMTCAHRLVSTNISPNETRHMSLDRGLRMLR
jgi:hypothetical protein